MFWAGFSAGMFAGAFAALLVFVLLAVRSHVKATRRRTAAFRQSYDQRQAAESLRKAIRDLQGRQPHARPCSKGGRFN